MATIAADDAHASRPMPRMLTLDGCVPPAIVLALAAVLAGASAAAPRQRCAARRRFWSSCQSLPTPGSSRSRWAVRGPTATVPFAPGSPTSTAIRTRSRLPTPHLHARHPWRRVLWPDARGAGAVAGRGAGRRGDRNRIGLGGAREHRHGDRTVHRAATVSLGYHGDSVLNSVADIVACAIGFLLAWRIPTRASRWRRWSWWR